jgi:hypothetical protein
LVLAFDQSFLLSTLRPLGLLFVVLLLLLLPFVVLLLLVLALRGVLLLEALLLLVLAEPLARGGAREELFERWEGGRETLEDLLITQHVEKNQKE